MNLKSLHDNPMMTSDGLLAAERVVIREGISIERALNYIGELEDRIRRLEDRLDNVDSNKKVSTPGPKSRPDAV